MTKKGHRFIRGRRDSKSHDDLFVQFDLILDPKGHGVIRGRRDLLLKPKVAVTFVFGLT